MYIGLAVKLSYTSKTQLMPWSRWYPQDGVPEFHWAAGVYG